MKIVGNTVEAGSADPVMTGHEPSHHRVETRHAWVRLAVGDGVRRAALGLAIGLALALAAGSAMSGILIDVSPRDPVTFAGVTAVLAIVSWAGLWIPARRAARVDPVQALAAE